MTIYLLLITLGLLAFHIYVQYNRIGRLVNKIPGPTPFPLIGNAPIIFCSTVRLWKRVRKLSNLFYPVLRVWWPTFPIVILRHPDDIKILTACKTNIEKSYLVYDNFRFAGGTGLLASGGEKWHFRRKMVNPAFSTMVMKSYIDIANDHVKTCIEYIKSQGNQIKLELHPLCMKLTMGIICEAAMSYDLNKVGTEYERTYRNFADFLFATTLYRLQMPYIKNWMMRFLPIGRKQETVKQLEMDFANKVIKERRDYHESSGYEAFKDYLNDDSDTEDINIISGVRRRLGLLDILLLAEKKGLIDHEGIIEEVHTFILTGYETVGAAALFVLLILADNKEAQNLARAEVMNILGANEDKITAVELQKMEYLDRCVKESLRLFPAAPFFGRLITEDIQLKNCFVPAGIQVIVDIYSLHRDANFWPEPDKFNPDRFLPENIQDRHSHAYMPFSSGLRSCIGQQFAMQELKLIISQILYNFYLEPVNRIDDLIMKVDITLKTVHPTYVKFVKINN